MGAQLNARRSVARERTRVQWSARMTPAREMERWVQAKSGEKEHGEMSINVAIAIGAVGAVIWGVCMALMLGAVAC